MIVLSESTALLPPSASARDLAASTEAAKLLGCSVYYLPQSFAECGGAEGALWNVPAQSPEATAIWLGYIPDFEHYCAIYEAALAKGIRLVNSPEEHQTAQEFDRAYPKICGFTPQSVVITNPAECAGVANRLGFPIFVKGAIQSQKALGRDACVANDLTELRTLAADLLDRPLRSRGRVILRRFVRLRHSRVSGTGFPLGREYRLFVHEERIVGFGYYWEGKDPLADLSSSEREQVEALALAAASRLRVPYLAIDIGQLESGVWIVIETGDGQFSGYSQTQILQLWDNLVSHYAESFSARFRKQ